jgi:hypothetical protein
MSIGAGAERPNKTPSLSQFQMKRGRSIDRRGTSGTASTRKKFLSLRSRAFTFLIVLNDWFKLTYGI